MVGADQAFVLVESWLGPAPPPIDRSEPLGLLARRYLTGRSPVSSEDLAKWAGISLADARQGFACASEGTGHARAGAGVDFGPAARTPSLSRTRAIAEKATGPAIAEKATGTAMAKKAPGTAMANGRLPSPRLLGPFDPLLHGWVCGGRP